jgi:hypothetical protein
MGARFTRVLTLAPIKRLALVGVYSRTTSFACLSVRSPRKTGWRS